MKRFLLWLPVFLLFLSCTKNAVRNNNPYLPNYNFSSILNLNLPLFSPLNSNLNPMALTLDSDINVLVMKVSGSEYRAWNANCPNQSPAVCSNLVISGLNGKCNCDEILYSLFTGIGSNNVQYTMIPYRVEILGNNSIRIYN